MMRVRTYEYYEIRLREHWQKEGDLDIFIFLDRDTNLFQAQQKFLKYAREREGQNVTVYLVQVHTIEKIECGEKDE